MGGAHDSHDSWGATLSKVPCLEHTVLGKSTRNTNGGERLLEGNNP